MAIWSNYADSRPQWSRRQEGGFQLTHSLFCTTYSTIAILKINFIRSPYKPNAEIANIRMATTENTKSYCRYYSTAISQSKLPSRKEVTGMICEAVTAPWQQNEQTRRRYFCRGEVPHNAHQPTVTPWRYRGSERPWSLHLFDNCSHFFRAVEAQMWKERRRWKITS